MLHEICYKNDAPFFGFVFFAFKQITCQTYCRGQPKSLDTAPSVLLTAQKSLPCKREMADFAVSPSKSRRKSFL